MLLRDIPVHSARTLRLLSWRLRTSPAQLHHGLTDWPCTCCRASLRTSSRTLNSCPPCQMHCSPLSQNSPSSCLADRHHASGGSNLTTGTFCRRLGWQGCAACCSGRQSAALASPRCWARDGHAETEGCLNCPRGCHMCELKPCGSTHLLPAVTLTALEQCAGMVEQASGARVLRAVVTAMLYMQAQHLRCTQKITRLT